MRSCILDLYVPSKKELIPFREINMTQQLNISKASAISNDLYCTELLYELIEVMQENCPGINIFELSLYDFLLIILGLRASSIGVTVPLNIICNKCKTTHKYDLRLDKMYSDLCQAQISTQVIRINDFQFTVNIPSLDKELENISQLKYIAFKDDPDILKLSFILNIDRYVQSVTNNNNNTLINLTSIIEKREFYDKFSIASFSDLLLAIQKIQLNYPIFNFSCGIKGCDKKIYKTLNWDIDKYYFLIKLLFNDSIIDIFKNMFYLQKIGIPMNYSEKLTSQETKIIWNFFDELEQKKNNISKKQNMGFGPTPGPSGADANTIQSMSDNGER